MDEASAHLNDELIGIDPRLNVEAAAREVLASQNVQRQSLRYFDRVYLLNLDSATERLQKVDARLERLGVAFERIAASLPRGDEPQDSARPDLHPAHFAAARAHRMVLEHALRQNHQRVLLLEDDVVFRDDLPAWMEKLAPQLDSVPWDVFYLGLDLAEDGGPLTPNLRKVGLGFQTHAYAVSRRAIPLLLELIDQALADCFDFDSFEHPDLLKVYCTPILAIQDRNTGPAAALDADPLCQYFPPFDRRDFLNHCREARGWASIHRAGRLAAELLQQAKRLHRSGRSAGAEPLYCRVLSLEPDNADALHFLGLLKHQRGEGPAAIDLLRRALSLRPDSAEFNCNLGAVLGQSAGPEEGLELLSTAIQLRSDYPEAYDNLGILLAKLGRGDDAVAAWSMAIELRPKFAEASHHLGNFLLRSGDAQQAISHLKEAVRLNPRNAGAHNDLGCAFRQRGEGEAALAAFRLAAQRRPAMAEAQCNVGTALSDLGRPQEAIPYLEKAVDLRPDFADAHWNLSVALLACGDFERGWLGYEWRRHKEKDQAQFRSFKEPAWNGCNITGRTILVTCEQGLGDTLQFIRYAPLLAQRGTTVIVECQPPLCELLRGIGGIHRVVAQGEPLPRFDTHVRLLTLPGIFGTRLGDVPNQVPYLSPDPTREAQWKARLGNRGFTVGISWQGSKAFPNDRTRSLPLSYFEPLGGIVDVRLISLQKNDGVEQIEQLAGRFPIELPDPPLDEGCGAFVDTAALIRNLDLVVTSDTAIAHLAGALGVPVWVALSFDCEWRWMRDREDSPWYPTMRLFRQRVPGDWVDVFARVAAALRDTVMAAPAEEAPPVLAPIPPGELIDRLTILQIKMQRLTDPEKLRGIRAELEHLSAVRDRSLPAGEQLNALARELRTINETLWQLEDDIRAADQAEDPGPHFIELARAVYRTNDRRAAVKRQVNILLGSMMRDEKQYRTCPRSNVIRW